MVSVIIQAGHALTYVQVHMVNTSVTIIIISFFLHTDTHLAAKLTLVSIKSCSIIMHMKKFNVEVHKWWREFVLEMVEHEVSSTMSM